MIGVISDRIITTTVNPSITAPLRPFLSVPMEYHLTDISICHNGYLKLIRKIYIYICAIFVKGSKTPITCKGSGVINMKKMNIKIGAYFCIVITVISLFTVIPSTTVGESRTDIVLVRVNNANEILYMESVGAEIIEEYGKYVLIEACPNVVSMIEDFGLDIDKMDYRTKLCVSGHVFDIRDGEPEMPDELHLVDYETGTKGIYLVHMIGPIAKNWRPTLEEMGVEVMNYMHNFAYRVRMTPELANEVSELYFVDWVGVFHPYYKLQSGLEPGIVDIFTVSCENTDYLIEIQNIVGTYSLTELGDNNGYLIRSFVDSYDTLYEIARINNVFHISQYMEPVLEGEMATQIIGGGQ